MGPSSEAHQHPANPSDLCAKLNKMRSKVAILKDDYENLQHDSSRMQARGHRTLAPKEDAPPMMAKIEGSVTFTLLNVPIDQIFHVIKHQP